MAAMFDDLKRINTVLIDFSRDVWQYISMEYFKQKIKEGEVGSSAMPHKVNPIDFENAEGNLGFANRSLNTCRGNFLFRVYSAILRFDRTAKHRSSSRAFVRGTSILLKGLCKLEFNEGAIHRDLDNNWAVVAEAIQTILRKEGYPNPYEALKTLTRKNE